MNNINENMNDSYVLKLSGKAELPQPLEIGHNIKTVLEGSITSKTETDNEDGSHTHYYLFKPITVEAIDSKGERIRAKDTRSRSTQMRSLLFKRWREQNVAEEFDEWYDKEMVRIMSTL